MKEFAEKWVLSLYPVPRLHLSDGTLVGITNTKILLLIGRLIDSRVPIQRAKLSEEFWPQSEYLLPRENLRAAIYSIKQTLGADILVTSGEWVSIRPGQVRLIHAMPARKEIREGVDFDQLRELKEALDSGSSDLGQLLVDSEFALELAPVDLGIRILTEALTSCSLGSLRPRVKAMRLYLKTVEGTSLSHLPEIDVLCEKFKSNSDLAGLFRIAISGSHTHLSAANIPLSRAYARTAVGAAQRSNNSLILGQAYLALALVNAHGLQLQSASRGLIRAKECFEEANNLVLAGTAAMLLAEVAFCGGEIELAGEWITEMERCFSNQPGRMLGWGEIQKSRLDRANGRQENAFLKLASATQLTKEQAGFSAHARAYSEMSLLLEEQGEDFESAIHLGYSDRYRWKFKATATELERRTTRELRARLRVKLNPSEQRSARRIAARRVESAFQSRAV